MKPCHGRWGALLVLPLAISAGAAQTRTSGRSMPVGFGVDLTPILGKSQARPRSKTTCKGAELARVRAELLRWEVELAWRVPKLNDAGTFPSGFVADPVMKL